MTLVVNFTFCPRCVDVCDNTTDECSNAGYTPDRYDSFCGIGYETCERSELENITASILDPHQVRTLVYRDIVVASFVFVSMLAPHVLGLDVVTGVTLAGNRLCAHHPPVNRSIPVANWDVGLTYFYKVGFVDGWHLEWIRPFFSCFLVLCVSIFLRRFTAGRAT